MKGFAGQKIAVFDLEIKKPIEECSHGWDSFNEMGVSVLVLFDYREERYRVFDDNNITEALEILNQYDIVAGFNTVKFDWKVLNATYPYEKARFSSDYDILREIWISLNLNPDVFNPATHQDISWMMLHGILSDYGSQGMALERLFSISKVDGQNLLTIVPRM